MKKVIATLLVLCMAAGLAACGSSSPAPASTTAAAAPAATEAAKPAETTAAAAAATEAAKTEAAAPAAAEGPVKIGVFQPLTGQASYMGQAGFNGAEIAQKEINAAGGILGREVQLIAYDDKSSPEEAVKCVNKMIEVDQVDGVIGSLHSGNVQAVGDIIEEAKIPCLGTGTSPQWLQKGWTYMFRPTISTWYTSLAAVDICDTLGMKKIAIFSSQDEYGKNGHDNMMTLCDQYGIEVVAEESMKPGDSDFTAQVANIEKGQPDGVYIIATADNLPQMVKGLRQGGIDGYLFGEQSLGMPPVKEIAGTLSNDIVFGACFIMPATDPAEAQIPALVDFFTTYRDTYGENCPSEVSVRCYDALYIYKLAAEKAGTTEGTAVRDAIYTITDYEGLQGKFDFSDKSGEGLTTSRLYITEDLKDIPLDEWLAQNK